MNTETEGAAWAAVEHGHYLAIELMRAINTGAIKDAGNTELLPYFLELCTTATEASERAYKLNNEDAP